MLNPYDPSNGMYVNLRRRVVQNLKALGIEGSILEVVQTAYEEALRAENIMLAPIEKKKLFSDVLKLLFEDMSNDFDGKQN
ncbi:MAG: hypothetical protein JNM55_07775 [Anaerolineales bacterium]|nr:hypothetical protein [Anaerolineales bacterium]